ncbi:integrin alpha-M-like [Symphorus nematophorus]
MDRIITTAIFLSVFEAALCFNIDPVAWKSLSNRAAGFGYQVVQRQKDLLVSAPLEQYSSNGRGQIYKCTTTTSCSQLPVQLPAFAVNMSLGLAMTNDPITQYTMACGPTIPKECTSITMYNGICLEIGPSNVVEAPKPSSLEVCRSAADIAFLLDGSGSVDALSFIRMKEFVVELVRSFVGKETQFAIAQFSSSSIIHYYFDTFDQNNWKYQIDRIRQLTGGTYTASAIRNVVNNVFTPSRGSRSQVKRVLVVITDGESHERNQLPQAAKLAQDKKIVRFAIGVGNAFSKHDARQELNTIASSPPENHVFQVQSFDALEQIRQSLQDKIFSIEGSQTSGESLKMEMSQEGFSAAYVPGGVQMAIVGANQWKGGYMQYTGNKRSSYEPLFMKPDSYLGYSIAVAKTSRGPLTIIGAPRYDHRGVVMTVDSKNNHKKIDPFPWQFQSGEYFGAEVCAMDVDRTGDTDLVLISAPMYADSDREGRVYVCVLFVSNVECDFASPSVLRGDASDKGRFGSSLAVLPDLNADGLSDLAVGAPLENDGQGSIYIFHSEGRQRISLTHSQRIDASKVQPGLMLFGVSISQSSFDHSGDGLPDLAVGAKGVVVLLRSKPIVMVEATVSFSPNQIPIQNTALCSESLRNKAQICFTMSRHSAVTEAQARINFTLTLDATRKAPNNRAYITEKERMATRSVILVLQQQQCVDVNFFVEGCPEDALNALSNELRFTFEGLPSKANLSPSLAQQAQTTTFHALGFEINCGSDDKCVDNLEVDFNFTSSLVVKVGIDELLDVTVSVENKMENSYNSRVILTYPPGLSYRKFKILKGRIECNSLDSEDGSSRGKTDCTIDKPIFKGGAKASFTVSYGIDTNSQLDSTIFVTANATSGNQEHSTSSQLYKKREIDVKYSIFVTFESRLSYYNFTFGKNNLQKPFEQAVVVTNDIRILNFTVVIKVPVKLGDKDIWVDSSSLQFPACQTVKDAEPHITDFVAEIQKNKIVDCSVAKCRVFKCSRVMGKLESDTFKISANLSSGWIEQIGLQSAKFLLTSTASMEYDRNQYIFASAGSNNNPPVRKIQAEVEVYPEPDFTKEIVGGSLGGLALLALLTAGLYKAGFFTSKYKEMMNEAAEAGADGGPAPDQQE